MNAFSKIVSAFLVSVLFATASYADDGNALKLQELERAMRASPTHDIGGEGGGVESPGARKVRKRAIVFDSAEQTPANPSQGVTTSPKADCSSLTSEVKAEPIDFAVQFKVGSAEVASNSEVLLLQISKVLALSPDRCVLVEGHTDASGNADKNLLLSRERANAVVKFISEKGGVNSARLVPIGKGSSDPLKNLDARDQKNRRVVFKVVSG